LIGPVAAGGPVSPAGASNAAILLNIKRCSAAAGRQGEKINDRVISFFCERCFDYCPCGIQQNRARYTIDTT
jgi:hypothetical protein